MFRDGLSTPCLIAFTREEKISKSYIRYTLRCTTPFTHMGSVFFKILPPYHVRPKRVKKMPFLLFVKVQKTRKNLANSLVFRIFVAE
jgi:hypothetical protein